MSSTLNNTQLSLNFDTTETRAVGIVTPSAQIQYRKTLTFDSGTGVGQANMPVTISDSVVSGVPNVIDLRALIGAFAATYTLAKLKGIIIENTATSGNLKVGGNNGGLTSNILDIFGDAATAPKIVGPGDFIVLSAKGNPITVDATHRNLVMDASAGTVTFKVIILGTDA